MHIKSLTLNRQAGVSLIEVLVAILIIAVGVLGLAKMQALTIANTQVSGSRGLIALQASSLASLMHSDKGFWQVPSGTIPECQAASCNLSGSSTTKFGSMPTSCSFTSQCSLTQMAAWDVNNWMSQISANVPTYNAIINCDGGVSAPVVCSIEITWLEKQSGGGTTTASIAAATPSVEQAYYLYVTP